MDLKETKNPVSKKLYTDDVAPLPEKPIYPMSRAERRKKLKWLKKQLTLHLKKSPVNRLNIDINSDTEDTKNIDITRAWVTRLAVLKKKISELEPR